MATALVAAMGLTMLGGCGVSKDDTTKGKWMTEFTPELLRKTTSPSPSQSPSQSQGTVQEDKMNTIHSYENRYYNPISIPDYSILEIYKDNILNTWKCHFTLILQSDSKSNYV